MKRVLVTHAGGRIGIGFSRALREAPEPVYVIGADSDRFKIHRAETDVRHLIPRANEWDFIPILRSVIEETQPDLLWVQHEAEIAVVSQCAPELEVRTFLPDPGTIATCQDKMASYECLNHAGVPVPDSLLIKSKADLEWAFRDLGECLWLRAVKGTGGNGALAVSDLATAVRWIDLRRGWGHFMAARRLSDQTATWESVWADGRLVACQGRKRLYWEFSGLTPTGVTGICGAHQWIADPIVDEIAVRAIHAIDPRPHGVFSVDFTYDNDGALLVTEINVGRFMSGGAIHYPTCEATNFPYIVLKVALGEWPEEQAARINPLPTDVTLIHGMDVEPVVIPTGRVQAYQDVLQERHRRASRGLSGSRAAA